MESHIQVEAPTIKLVLTAKEAYQLKSAVQNGPPHEAVEDTLLRQNIFNALPSFEKLIEWIQLP